ncbi:hypothetical protein AC578_7653 [Pseudocercospora eumusae]|uniref:Rab-GAP TBC domain-containing protein n=1 Tax=Pseudocercospora eumusae TaxID=321146 RepID=A0A139H5V3_9PEZI|nr:hypothetical protein AC578_7653 [Pseudocercospora eumusae]
MQTRTDTDLSRRSSRQPLVPADDTTSLTSFPDPADSTSSPSLQGINEPVVHADVLVEPQLAPVSEPLNGLLDTGPSMFDRDDPELLAISEPQTLAAGPTHVLQKIVDHRGAVELVRHLSTLLAERDAHVTALTSLAQEYKIPQEKIAETASRAQQAERRRLSLAAAASEDLAPTNTSESSESAGAPDPVVDAFGTIRALTKLFGGAGKKKESVRPAASIRTASSSRSGSRQPPPVKARNERPKSIDVLSINSVNSGDSMNWLTSTFGGAAGTIKGLSGNARRDSRAAREPRAPVEMSTRHDEAQLPPTLSRQSLSQPAKTQHEAAWNKFLLKLKEVREQAGEEAQEGELLGSSRWGTEGSNGREKLAQLSRLVTGGIPMRFRKELWKELSNTQAIIEPDAYERYLNMHENQDPQEIDAILKDVPRTLTSKYDYYAEKGYDRLKRVLIAFVNKYPGLGYTQGLNLIAGYLLLAVPDESDAFWLLCNMVDNYFPKDYFSREADLNAPISDNNVLRQYIKELLPRLAEKLNALDIPPDHTVPLNWFLTAFAAVLPESVLLRVWDVWLCIPDQKAFLFNVALSLLAQHHKQLLACETDGDYWAYTTSQMKVSEEPDKVNELIRQARLIGRKLDGVSLRRSLEISKRVKKHASTEALYSPDPEPAHAGADL